MTELYILNRDDNCIAFHPESLRLFSFKDRARKIMTQNKLEFEFNQILENLDCSDMERTSLLNYIKDKTKIHLSKDLKWIGKEPRVIYLIVSQVCNLQCGYCFADQGTFGGEKKIISFDTAKKSMEKLLGKEYNNFILFYGGEPFLNFSLMEDVEEYGRGIGLGAKYTSITNGTIINDAIEKFIHEKFFSLSISLDGPKEINDNQRYGDVESVHDKVVTTIDRLKLKRIPLTIKCIVTKKNYSELDDIAKYLATFDVTSIAFADVSRIPPESEFFLSDVEFEVYAKDLSQILVKNLNRLAAGENIPIIAPIFSILRKLITRTRVTYHCSAGREFLAVTADGDVYPCHGFVRLEEFKMGNIHDKDFPGEAYNKIKDIFNNRSIYTCNERYSCWARFLCGGCCAANCYIYNGDLSQPVVRHCIEIKSILNALLPEIADIFQDKTKMLNIMRNFSRGKDIPQNILEGRS